MPDIFKAIIAGRQIEDAVETTIKLWLQTYLREMELQLGIQRNTYPDPASWEISPHFEKWSENRLPAVLIVSPGLAREPRMSGDGSYRAVWTVGIGVIVSAMDYDSTKIALSVYIAAIRALILQKQSLGGIANVVEWVDESYDDLPNLETGETAAGGQVVFNVEVADVVNKRGGPAIPSAPDPVGLPGSQWPQVITVGAIVEPKN